jgi:hypothetical protein
MVNTKRMEDVQWLYELIREVPLYSKVATEDLDGHFDNVWNKYAVDDDTMYIKIDDDIVSYIRCNIW